MEELQWQYLNTAAFNMVSSVLKLRPGHCSLPNSVVTAVVFLCMAKEGMGKRGVSLRGSVEDM